MQTSMIVYLGTCYGDTGPTTFLNCRQAGRPCRRSSAQSLLQDLAARSLLPHLRRRALLFQWPGMIMSLPTLVLVANMMPGDGNCCPCCCPTTDGPACYLPFQPGLMSTADGPHECWCNGTRPAFKAWRMYAPGSSTHGCFFCHVIRSGADDWLKGQFQ